MGNHQVLPELIEEFDKETKGNKRMEVYTDLLQQTMREVIGVQEEVGLDSLATPGGTIMMSGSISQEENLELISYLIIK
jgi:methionine synthase II (cobalamin-independent)